jgi:predicted transcriptional regulator
MTRATTDNRYMPMATAKQITRELIEHLPDEASWDDIHYALHVRQKIEAGREATAAGRTVPHEQVMARLMERKRRAS